MARQSTSERLLADRYRVLDRLGSGGMATVLLAEDGRLGRRVAIKRLHADSPVDIARRFHREARLLASLSHPNVVAIFDTVADDEGVLIVMEHVEGETLREALRRGPLGAERTIEVVAGVAAALDHAHERGVVHRDVKPGNVLLGAGGAVKLADLGIARATEATQITRSGALLGTPSYMAPEQLDGGAVSPAVDVYALGALAFEALAGRKARPGRTPVEIARLVTSEPPPDLRAAWPGAPAAAANALRRAMARDPAARQRTAGELADELATALGEGVSHERRRAAAGAAAAGAAPRVAGAAPRVAGAAPRVAGAAPRVAGAAPPAAHAAAAGAAPRAAAAAAAGAAPRVAGGAARAAGAAPRERSRRERRATLAGAAGARRALPLALLGVVLAAALAIALAAGGDDGAPTADRDAALPPAERDTGRAERRREREQRAPAPAGGEAAGADPAEGRRLNDEGYRLLQGGQPEAAVPVLERAVEAFGDRTDDINYAYALFNLGRALRLAGRPAEAIPILERRLQIPNQTDVVERELELARAEAAGGAPGGDEGDDDEGDDDDGPGRGNGRGKRRKRD